MGWSIMMRDEQVIIAVANKNRMGRLYAQLQLTELYFK